MVDKELHRERVGRAVRRSVLRDKPVLYEPFRYYNRIKTYREEMEQQKNQINRKRMLSSQPLTASNMRISRWDGSGAGATDVDLSIPQDSNNTKEII